ncbi:MAG: hypothetical protein AAGI92_04630 [Pseudomonadota bacterium]
MLFRQRLNANSINGPKSLKNAVLAATCAVTLASCQSTEDTLAVAPEEVITEADLRAYCPPVVLRDGTASYRTYANDNETDPNSVVYQASIKEQTRDCRYRNGQLLMTVAVAGRVVPGPQGSAGTVNLPIRVAITEGSATAYSNLDQYPVNVEPTAGASQFLYRNDSIVLPEPADRNMVIYIGFDEGPYDTP